MCFSTRAARVVDSFGCEKWKTYARCRPGVSAAMRRTATTRNFRWLRARRLASFLTLFRLDLHKTELGWQLVAVAIEPR
jgi:hypothetical protein